MQVHLTAEGEVDYDRDPVMTDTPVHQTEIVNGYIINIETGEVLDLAEAPAQFEVTDADTADWVLDKMQHEDGEIFALTARIQAVTARLTAVRKAHQDRRAWLEMRFGADLAAFARKELAGGKKGKTVKLTYGSLSFRTNSGGALVVLDEAAALEWAKENAEECVVYTPRISKTALKERDDLPGSLFERTAPSEAFKIDTGIK